MIKYSEKIMSKKFTDAKSKDAYLKACKWLATKILSKDELARNITFSVEKEKSQLPTFKVTLFVNLDENELREEHCKICKETHGSFFINENCNCSWCNASAYQKRTDRMIAIKRASYIEVLKKMEDEEWQD